MKRLEVLQLLQEVFSNQEPIEVRKKDGDVFNSEWAVDQEAILLKLYHMVENGHPPEEPEPDLWITRDHNAVCVHEEPPVYDFDKKRWTSDTPIALTVSEQWVITLSVVFGIRIDECRPLYLGQANGI